MKKRKLILIPSKSLDVIVVTDSDELNEYLDDDNAFILRIHHKLKFTEDEFILPESIDKDEAKDAIKSLGIDLTNL